MSWKLLQGDVMAKLAEIETGTVHTCITSPPYWSLRDYGTDGQIGLEKTPEEYVAKMVQVFREVRRVLRDDGCLWLNLGDSYAGGGRAGNNPDYHKKHKMFGKDGWDPGVFGKPQQVPIGLKPKDLVGIPWRVAFALQADGWYLRSDIIWCLSGGAWVYVQTQKGEMPMMVKDMARLDPKTVKLWNGKKWTQLLGMSRSERKGDELEIVLRSGERISCTPSHKFPTENGLKNAKDIKLGDVLKSCTLPEPQNVRDCVIDEDAAWLAGLYIAEGSRSEDTIQIAGHARETERWENIKRIALKYGGSATITVDGNKSNVRMYGKVLNAIIDELVTGKTAKDKGFAPTAWQYSNGFISAMLDGYLSGDGHCDKKNNRWRIGFTRNYNLERDLRIACARLDYKLTLNLSTATCQGKQFPAFRGEIRKTWSNHWNNKPATQVIEIRKARCRYVWDIGVEDEPHLYALSSGVLTHNSKPNPMPESVTDRPTKAHEYIFLLSKSGRYFYDADAIKEMAVFGKDMGVLRSVVRTDGKHVAWHSKSIKDRQDAGVDSKTAGTGFRNKRSVWTVATQSYPEAHFATFPPKLIEPCILAGASPKACEKCGAPWERVVEREPMEIKRSGRGALLGKHGRTATSGTMTKPAISITTGWQPTCTCENEGKGRCIVLDPFAGSGTTLWVAEHFGRDSIGIELSPEYCELINKRMSNRQMTLFERGLLHDL